MGDAGNGGDSRDELVIERNAITRIGRRTCDVYIDREYTIAIESKWQRHEPLERPHQEPRRHDEHHRQRHLGDDEAAGET